MTERFPERVPRAARRQAGRTPAALTPMHVRTLGTHVDEATRSHVQGRISRQFGKVARSIERVTVRFRDTNGLRGGIDQQCRIKIVLFDRPSVVAEATAITARAAFDRAAATAKGIVFDRPAARARGTRAAVAQPSSADMSPGSGARTAGAADDQAPQSTALRNLRLNTAGLTSALEDSAQERPSRKSTRRSANRSKRDSNLRRRELRRVHAAKTRAMRSAVQNP